jgi:hypothetical protein
MEHFQDKWAPVFRSENATNTLEHFQDKWAPVFRSENATNTED